MSRSLSDRMKELSKAGYISNYAGEPYLRQDIEVVMNRKSEVIKEFMQKVKDREGFVSGDNPMLPVDSGHYESMLKKGEANLLGEV